MVEYALLARLLATLPKEDGAVGHWAVRQAQLQRAACSQKEATQIRFGNTTKWSSGQVVSRRARP